MTDLRQSGDASATASSDATGSSTDATGNPAPPPNPAPAPAPAPATTVESDWARRMLAALHQRQDDLAVGKRAAAVIGTAPALKGGKRGDRRRIAAPKGVGPGLRAALPASLGKQVMQLFGQPDARRGDYDARIAEATAAYVKHGVTAPADQEDVTELKAQKAAADDRRRRIDDQRTLGTAVPVTLESEGGRVLSGNFFGANSKAINGAPDLKRPVVLCLSGSGGTAEDQSTDVAEFYQDIGASVLSVNYGGYGGSTAMDPSEKTMLEDAQAMLEHLRDLGYQDENIIIHGYSLGGAIAGKLQAHNDKNDVKLGGLVLDRPMLSSTAGVKGQEGSNTNEPVLKAAAARSVLGSMSARKAILASNSAVPMVVTSDEIKYRGTDEANTPRDYDFAQSAELFRAKLAGKGRKVSGEGSGKDHLDHRAMINTNGDYLRNLVNGAAPGSPGSNGTPALSNPDDFNTKTADTLARAVEDKTTEIARRVSDTLQAMKAYQSTFMKAPIDDQKRDAYDRYLVARADELADRRRALDAMAASIDLLSSASAKRVSDTAAAIKSITAVLRGERLANGTAPLAGGTLPPDEIAVVGDLCENAMLSLSPSAEAGANQTFLEHRWPALQAYAAAGVIAQLPDRYQKMFARAVEYKRKLDGQQAATQPSVAAPLTPPPVPATPQPTPSVRLIARSRPARPPQPQQWVIGRRSGSGGAEERG